jgi:DNA-binding LacI/PurR family transcriptional regulator
LRTEPTADIATETRTRRLSAPADKEAEVRRLVTQMPGQRLPGEREWATQLNISRPQLRAILAVLRREGIVEQRQGSGTYAVDPRGEPRLRRVALLIDSRLKFGDDPFFSFLLERLQAQLQAEGVRCLIERISEADATQDTPHTEDGMLTLGMVGETLLARHRSGQPPLVALLLGPKAHPQRSASVFQLDDREGGRDAVQSLVGGGCRDLLYVGRDDIPAAAERHAGAAEAAGERGISLQFQVCGLNYAAGLRLGRTLAVEENKDPLGIIATNDWLAVGLRAGLQDRGEAVHREIRIVSFDGLPITADPALKIASLMVPIETIAQDAVAELHRLVRPGAGSGRILRYPFSWRQEKGTGDV